MSGEGVAAWVALVQTIRDLGPFGAAIGIIILLYRGYYISKRESDERVAAAVATGAAALSAEQEKVKILERELEKREGLYIASLAEIRAQVHNLENRNREIHDEKWRVLTQLAESNREMYRMTDAISDLTEAVKRIREVR